MSFSFFFRLTLSLLSRGKSFLALIGKQILQALIRVTRLLALFEDGRHLLLCFELAVYGVSISGVRGWLSLNGQTRSDFQIVVLNVEARNCR